MSNGIQQGSDKTLTPYSPTDPLQNQQESKISKSSEPSMGPHSRSQIKETHLKFPRWRTSSTIHHPLFL